MAQTNDVIQCYVFPEFPRLNRYVQANTLRRNPAESLYAKIRSHFNGKLITSQKELAKSLFLKDWQLHSAIQDLCASNLLDVRTVPGGLVVLQLRASEER